jgi:hypothetical protein
MCNFIESQSRLKKSFKVSTLRKKKMTKSVLMFKLPSSNKTVKNALRQSKECS